MSKRRASRLPSKGPVVKRQRIKPVGDYVTGIDELHDIWVTVIRPLLPVYARACLRLVSKQFYDMDKKFVLRSGLLWHSKETPLAFRDLLGNPLLAPSLYSIEKWPGLAICDANNQVNGDYPKFFNSWAGVHLEDYVKDTVLGNWALLFYTTKSEGSQWVLEGPYRTGTDRRDGYRYTLRPDTHPLHRRILQEVFDSRLVDGKKLAALIQTWPQYGDLGGRRVNEDYHLYTRPKTGLFKY